VGTALERLDVVHRHLGLVVAVGLQVLGRDAELLAGDVEDRPLPGGLGNFDVGLRADVLRGGHCWGVRCANELCEEGICVVPAFAGTTAGETIACITKISCRRRAWPGPRTRRRRLWGRRRA